MIVQKCVPAVAVLLVLTAACGSPVGVGEPAPRSAIEACDRSEEGVDAGMDRVGSAVARTDTWIDLRGLEVITRDDDRVRAAATVARTRSGRSSAVHELAMPAVTADIAMRDLDANLPVVVGLTPVPGGGMALELLVVFRDGEPLFVGNCLQSYSDEFARFARQRGKTSSAVLEEVAAGGTGTKEALGKFSATPPTPTPWKDRPAHQRQIDESETPKETLERLQQVQLNFQLPEPWLDFDGLLCPKTSVGWSTCAAFDAETPVGTSGGGPLSFYSYKLPGEPLELWVVSKQDGILAPLGRLAEFTGTPAEQAGVIHEGDEGITSLEQLLDEAQSRAVFRTAPRSGG